MSGFQYRSRFGDTTLTKVFVGGLAWETPNEELRRYFQQFGEILEAVVITDKNTGRSKGYGFVTFGDPESARRSCLDPNPLIDGRRANCNIASLGRPRYSPPRGRNLYQGPPQATAPPYTRIQAQMPPPPPPVMYPPYGYMAYTTDYGYQQGVYNTQPSANYYNQMYGLSSSPTVGPPLYHYPHTWYTMNARASFSQSPQAHRPTYVQYPTAHGEGSFGPSSLPLNFQLQAPPSRRPMLNIPASDSQTSLQPSTGGTNTESSDA